MPWKFWNFEIRLLRSFVIYESWGIFKRNVTIDGEGILELCFKTKFLSIKFHKISHKEKRKAKFCDKVSTILEESFSLPHFSPKKIQKKSNWQKFSPQFQLFYVDNRNTVGYKILHNEHEVFQCTVMTHTEANLTKYNSCYTSGLVYLNSNDRLVIRNIHSREVVLEPLKSFFGLVRIPLTPNHPFSHEVESFERAKRAHVKNWEIFFALLNLNLS